MRQARLRIRTDKPDWSDVPDPEYDWAHTIYGDVKEQIPDDAPTPRGKSVVTTSYKDANLYHDYATGRSVS